MVNTKAKSEDTRPTATTTPTEIITHAPSELRRAPMKIVF